MFDIRVAMIRTAGKQYHHAVFLFGFPQHFHSPLCQFFKIIPLRIRGFGQCRLRFGRCDSKGLEVFHAGFFQKIVIVERNHGGIHRYAVTPVCIDRAFDNVAVPGYYRAVERVFRFRVFLVFVNHVIRIVLLSCLLVHQKG